MKIKSKQKKGIVLQFFGIFFLASIFLVPKPVNADVGDFSFNLHAPYNSFGKISFGPGMRENALSYIDRNIKFLGGIDTIRNSGQTGIVPAYEKGTLVIDQDCIDQQPEERKYICRTAQFKPESHLDDRSEQPWQLIDGPINHAAELADLLIEVNLVDKVDNLKYRRTQANVDTMIELTNKALDRYNGTEMKIKYWHTGNEPGVNRWAPEEKTDDGKILLGYATVELAKTVRNKCSDCKIVLAGIGWDPNWKGYIDAKTGKYILGYYDKLFQYFEEVGYKNAFDAVDFHLHNERYNSFKDGDYSQIKTKVDGLREILDKYGYQDIPIWITELSSWSGAPVEKNKDEAVTFTYPSHSEKDQASELVKRYLYAFSQGVKKVFWSPGILDFPNYGGVTDNYFSNIGLAYHSGEKKLSFGALSLIIEKLNGFTSAERLPTEDEKLYSLKFSFSSGKQPVYVFWREDGVRNISLANRLSYVNHDAIGATNLYGSSAEANFANFEVTSQPIIIESSSNFQEISCPSKVLGNLNCDREAKVNNADIETLISSWSPNQEGESIADLDSDWLVNEKDLNILLKKWRP